MSETTVKAPKKLIEVALPLDAINEAAVKEKGNPFLKGHPRNLHQYWARRPQGIARAVIFGQMVNDPSWKWEMEHLGELPPNNLKASWAASRNRLFAIIEDLVKWENTTNELVLEKARAEIRKSWRETCEINKDHPKAADLFNADKLPAFHDPFAGGGALPLEAQRLGLEAYASDLNPVAVLINKVMIEIPPKFAAHPPVNPEQREKRDLIGRTWQGAEGLANDVRYYGKWMRDEAKKRIGHLYPPIEMTPEMVKERPDLKPLVGQKLTILAWIWVRTVKSPNPAFHHVEVPLASTFVLSTKEGKEVYVDPVVSNGAYEFKTRVGTPPSAAKDGTKLSRGANFRCLLSGVPIEGDYIKGEGTAGRMGSRLMAIVAEGPRGRAYLSPSSEQEDIAQMARPEWAPNTPLPNDPRNFWTVQYGLSKYSDLFSARQLVALTTYSDLLSELRDQVKHDACCAGMSHSGDDLDNGGSAAVAYAEAITTIESLLIDKVADYSNSICAWNNVNENISHLFTKQSIPMAWDFCEASAISGGISPAEFAEGIAKAVEKLPATSHGYSFMHDASVAFEASGPLAISTDPPYYDNVGYADLSDFFYIWLRRSLKPIFPSLFATLATPKAEELVANPYRHDGGDKAEAFFLKGMTQAMRHLVAKTHPSLPVTIYYAFKQSETNTEAGTISTGWETFLGAVCESGFSITGTWPVRSERAARSVGRGTNALASSIVLVCRPRPTTAEQISRRTFLRELNQVLPQALDEMTRGSGEGRSPVAPVDLSQAIIGPGMAVFSKYAAVLEADGTPMSVKTALQLINRFLAEDDFDRDTQFCLHWFDQYGWRDGKFGDADTLARAKGTSVDGVKHAGVLFAESGVVRLVKWSDYPTDWKPEDDKRLPVWEVLHQLIRVFKTDGESGAGHVLAAVQDKAEETRQLAYRLYTLCERAGWAEDARAYNEIATSWSAIESVAAASPVEKQTSLFD